ncbi:hypothetical protein DLREEDagrD3_28930 [Denitratisoma sp. agr-D3]
MKSSLRKILVLGLAAFAATLASFGAFAADTVTHVGLGLDADHLLLVGFGGLIVNKENLNSLFISLKTTFNNAFSAAPSAWQKIAMLVPSTTASNDYKWLGKFPRMRKWVGEKVVKALEAFNYTITNDDWEATVEVDRNDIDDDNLGIYGPQAQSAGESAKQLPDEIVFALANGGFANKCYDGQYFFDTDHPVGDGAGNVLSISNKGTKALSCATLAAAQASLGAARTAMRKFKDDEGRPLGVRPNILLVPPALEDTANVLANNERLEDGKQNPYKGTVEVVVGDWLTSDTAWFLLDTTKAVKPFIYQQRKAPDFVKQTDPESDNVFNLKKFKFGAEARAAGGYGLWQLAYGSDGTT